MIYPGTIRPKITKIAHIQGSWPLEPTHFFEQMGRKSERIISLKGLKGGQK